MRSPGRSRCCMTRRRGPRRGRTLACRSKCDSEPPQRAKNAVPDPLEVAGPRPPVSCSGKASGLQDLAALGVALALRHEDPALALARVLAAAVVRAGDVTRALARATVDAEALDLGRVGRIGLGARG